MYRPLTSRASDKNKALFLLMTLTASAVLKMNPLQWFALSIKRQHITSGFYLKRCIIFIQKERASVP